jgi:hypothetical protein
VAFNPLVTILKLRESRHASGAIYLGMSDIALLRHMVTEQMKLIAQLRAEISQLRAAIA